MRGKFAAKELFLFQTSPSEFRLLESRGAFGFSLYGFAKLVWVSRALGLRFVLSSGFCSNAVCGLRGEGLLFNRPHSSPYGAFTEPSEATSQTLLGCMGVTK